MSISAIFFNFQSLLLTCLLYAATEMVRRFVQSLWKGWRRSRWYTDFFVWSLPMILGAVFGAALTSFPWPQGLDTASARATYASFLGLFCGAVYGRVKKYVQTSAPPP